MRTIRNPELLDEWLAAEPDDRVREVVALWFVELTVDPFGVGAAPVPAYDPWLYSAIEVQTSDAGVRRIGVMWRLDDQDGIVLAAPPTE
jgi:hypothetical protein